MDSPEIVSLITEMYAWFNHIADPANAFVSDDLHRYFTPDFIMEMNDKVVVTGDYALFQHFEKFRKGGYQLYVQLPLQEIMVSDDQVKCAVRYNIVKTSKDGNIYNIKVMAIWHIAGDGRLRRMNEVVYFEPAAEEGIN